MVIITKEKIKELLMSGRVMDELGAPSGSKPWIRAHKMIGTQVPQYKWDDAVNKSVEILEKRRQKRDQDQA